MVPNACKQSQVLRLVLNYCGATGSSSSCSSSASSQLLACWTALNREASPTAPTHAKGTQASRSLHSSSTYPRASSAVSLLGACHNVVPAASSCSHDNSNPWGRRLLPQQLAASQQHCRWKHTATQPARNDCSDTSSQATTQQQRQVPPSYTVFQLHQVLAGRRYKLLQRIGTLPSPINGRRATLWRGWDLAHNRAVDLKCLEAGDADSYSVGMREAILHAALGNCSNLSHMLDAFEHRSSSGRHPVMVFEQAGDALTTVTEGYSNIVKEYELEEGHVLSVELQGICNDPNALKTLARDLLTGLDYLHKRGVVHMAVEPANVVLDWQFKSVKELGPVKIPLKTIKRLDKLKSRLGWQEEWIGNKKKAADILREMSQEWEDAVTMQTQQQKVRTELDLNKATFKLRGLEHAACLNGNMPYLVGQPSNQARQVLKTPPTLFTAGGTAVVPDPSYQTPEEILGMDYIAPSYDIWQLGCLLFEAATGGKAFNANLRKLHLEYRKSDHGYNDQHYILACMVRVLGLFPRGYARHAAHRKQYFYQSESFADANTDMLKIQASLPGTLRIIPGLTPLHELLQMHTALDQDPPPEGPPQSRQFADFLSTMLRWEPSSRASAAELLQHDWLKPVDVKKVVDPAVIAAVLEALKR